MNFEILKNIETSFKQIKLFAIIYTVSLAVIMIYAVTMSFHFAEKRLQKIYVLDKGKSLLLALSEDVAANRPIEAKDHVLRFHELFFKIAPDKSAIERSINAAMSLSDKTAFNYYKDLREQGFYNRMITNNISQTLIVDSIVCNFDVYPFTAVTYAQQMIIRPTNVTTRSLVTSCRLIDTGRSDNNPHGFILEDFRVLENRDLATYERR